jgi:hypothetical protein
LLKSGRYRKTKKTNLYFIVTSFFGPPTLHGRSRDRDLLDFTEVKLALNTTPPSIIITENHIAGNGKTYTKPPGIQLAVYQGWKNRESLGWGNVIGSFSGGKGG